MNMYQLRREQVITKMKENELAGMILFPSPNMYYMTGFHTFPGERLLLAIFPIESDPFFIAPKLYESQIRQESWIQDIVCWTDEEDAYEILKTVFAELGINEGRFAIDDTMWADQFLGIMSIFPNLEFQSVGNLLNDLRLIKTADEIEMINKSSQIVDEVVEAVKELIKPGMTEIEVAALMEFEMRKRGSEGPSFETIVGSGPNSAIPHYNAGERKIQKGDFIVLDFGATYKGYCSDTTRTLCVGEPTPKMIEVYNIVKEAQEIGVRTAKPGIKASEVDGAVRQYIVDKGYGEYFTHRTGHGLGLQVHEEPYISGISDTILKPGMVFSVEPGIYIEGEFGVRIEDIVLVTETGCERFNNSSRKLNIIVGGD
ncbi:MAG: aminopeptidase P family protein [Halanaerobiales bacterium]|nr:aminopeptidase P family protein [Halanaerobiales bacterium]